MSRISRTFDSSFTYNEFSNRDRYKTARMDFVLFNCFSNIIYFQNNIKN
jgi:hypothetical protein